MASRLAKHKTSKQATNQGVQNLIKSRTWMQIDGIRLFFRTLNLCHKVEKSTKFVAVNLVTITVIL